FLINIFFCDSTEADFTRMVSYRCLHPAIDPHFLRFAGDPDRFYVMFMVNSYIHHSFSSYCRKIAEVSGSVRREFLIIEMGMCVVVHSALLLIRIVYSIYYYLHYLQCLFPRSGMGKTPGFSPTYTNG